MEELSHLLVLHKNSKNTNDKTEDILENFQIFSWLLLDINTFQMD